MPLQLVVVHFTPKQHTGTNADISLICVSVLPLFGRVFILQKQKKKKKNTVCKYL